MKNNNKDKKTVSGRPTAMDMLFGLVLIGVVAFVAWVGYLAYHEGLKIETSKRHGEAWLQWLGEASAQRFQPGFEPSACAGLAAPVVATAPAAALAPAAEASEPAAAPAAVAPESGAARVRNWGACFKALTQPEGPWAGQINPFSNEPTRLVAKCDKTDLTVAGQFFIEKLTPTPPGSPLPVVSSLLTDADVLDQKIQLRLTLCDKGGDPIRVGEVEF